jgi:hypothetical protein
MKKRQIEKYLKKRVLPSFSGFTVKGRMLYKKGADGLLRGYYFDQSASDADVLYVQCFVLPLYVPTSVVGFNFGDRLAHPDTGNSGWRIGSDDDECPPLLRRMEEANKDYLDRIKNPCDFAERFSAAIPNDIHTDEAVAYSWFLCGDTKRAIEHLLRVEQVEVTAPWIVEVKARGERIRHFLQDGELTAARNQLSDWRAESESALKL